MMYHADRPESSLAQDPNPADAPENRPGLPQDRSRETWWRNRPSGGGRASGGLSDRDIHPRLPEDPS